MKQEAKVLYHPCFGRPAVVNPRRRTLKAEDVPSLTVARNRLALDAADARSEPPRPDFDLVSEIRDSLRATKGMIKGMEESLELLMAERRLAGGVK